MKKDERTPHHSSHNNADSCQGVTKIFPAHLKIDYCTVPSFERRSQYFLLTLSRPAYPGCKRSTVATTPPYDHHNRATDWGAPWTLKFYFSISSRKEKTQDKISLCFWDPLFFFKIDSDLRNSWRLISNYFIATVILPPWVSSHLGSARETDTTTVNFVFLTFHAEKVNNQRSTFTARVRIEDVDHFCGEHCITKS
jgi:hypothetical protein